MSEKRRDSKGRVLRNGKASVQTGSICSVTLMAQVNGIPCIAGSW